MGLILEARGLSFSFAKVCILHLSVFRVLRSSRWSSGEQRSLMMLRFALSNAPDSTVQTLFI